MRAVSTIHVCQRVGRRGVLAYELLLVLVVLGFCWVGVCQIVGSARVESEQSLLSENGILQLKFSDADRQLWSFRRNDNVSSMDLESGEYRQIPVFVGRDVLRVAQSGDGLTMLVCLVDGVTTLVYDGSEQLSYHRSPTKCALDAVVSGDGTVALDISEEGHVHGWCRRDQATAAFDYNLPVGARIVRIFLDRTGTSLCVARANGVITFHNPVSGGNIRNSVVIGCDCLAFACLADQTKLAAFGSEGRIQILDLVKHQSPQEQVIEKSNPLTHVVCMKFSSDGRWLAVSTSGGSGINILNTDSCRFEGHLEGHRGIVRTFQFSSDSKRLISGGLDGTIREWSLEDWKQLREIMSTLR